MRAGIVAIGRMKAGPERELVSRYLDRARAMGKSLSLTGFEVTEHPESRASSANTRKREEAKALLGGLGDRAVLVALDERGKTLDSERFADRIAGWRDAGHPGLLLAIGGADGLDGSIRERADLTLSFSPMTWPHQIVRILAAEQLYRATTILSAHPYHRGD